MDTVKVKRALFKAMEKPTRKNLSALATQVDNLCNAYDSENSLGGVIRAGNEQLKTSYEMLERLRSTLNGR